jgi:hypothetical protein
MLENQRCHFSRTDPFILAKQASYLWFLLFVAAVALLASCKKELEITPPRGAELAVSTGKNWAATNGWPYPVLREIELNNGVWRMKMSSPESDDPDKRLTLDVTREGAVLFNSGPR